MLHDRARSVINGKAGRVQVNGADPLQRRKRTGAARFQSSPYIRLVGQIERCFGAFRDGLFGIRCRMCKNCKSLIRGQTHQSRSTLFRHNRFSRLRQVNPIARHHCLHRCLIFAQWDGHVHDGQFVRRPQRDGPKPLMVPCKGRGGCQCKFNHVDASLLDQ